MGQDVADVSSSGGVHAVGGFVEDDEFGVVHECLGETDALAHAFGVGPEFVFVPRVHTDEFEEFGGFGFALFALDSRECAEVFEDLSSGEVGGEAVVFWEVSDLLECCFVTDLAAEDGAAAFGGADDGHHDFDECGFARTVWTEESEDLALPDGHVDASEGFDASVVGFFNALDIDDGTHVVGTLFRATIWKTCQCLWLSPVCVDGRSSSMKDSSMYWSNRFMVSARVRWVRSSRMAQSSRSPKNWPLNRPPGSMAASILDQSAGK